MSLDNLKLNPFLVKQMYGRSLSDTAVSEEKVSSVQPKKNIAEETGNAIKFLGKNDRNILILVNEKENAFLGDEDLNFLITILNACKISVDDTALVNCCNNADAVYKKLNGEFSPEIILFFGIEPHELGFPVQIQKYRIQQYNKQQYLSAGSLQRLSADKEEKRQLWSLLKILFSVN